MSFSLLIPCKTHQEANGAKETAKGRREGGGGGKDLRQTLESRALSFVAVLYCCHHKEIEERRDKRSRERFRSDYISESESICRKEAEC